MRLIVCGRRLDQQQRTLLTAFREADIFRRCRRRVISRPSPTSSPIDFQSTLADIRRQEDNLVPDFASLHSAIDLLLLHLAGLDDYSFKRRLSAALAGDCPSLVESVTLYRSSLVVLIFSPFSPSTDAQADANYGDRFHLACRQFNVPYMTLTVDELTDSGLAAAVESLRRAIDGEFPLPTSTLNHYADSKGKQRKCKNSESTLSDIVNLAFYVDPPQETEQALLLQPGRFGRHRRLRLPALTISEHNAGQSWQLIGQQGAEENRFIAAEGADKLLVMQFDAKVPESSVRAMLLGGDKRQLMVAGQSVAFLGCSSGGLKQRKCYLWRGTADEVEAALAKLGEFQKISSASKRLSRTGLLFSAVRLTRVTVEPEWLLKADDIYDSNRRHCFTDGCGGVSPELARRICHGAFGSGDDVDEEFLAAMGCELRITVDRGRYVSLRGRVLVSKNPCYLLGDVRVLRAVTDEDNPGLANLSHLVDCIVFPVTGPRPHPGEIAGSDLDGDQYFVCWDPDLVPKQQVKPYDYPAAINSTKSIRSDQLARLDLLSYFAAQNANQRIISDIDRLYRDWADLLGPEAEQCRQLGCMFSRAIDAAKSGEAIPSDKLIALEKELLKGQSEAKQCADKFVWQKMVLNGREIRRSLAYQAIRRSSAGKSQDGAANNSMLTVESVRSEFVAELLSCREDFGRLGEFSKFQFVWDFCRSRCDSLEDARIMLRHNYADFVDFGRFSLDQKRVAIREIGLPAPLVLNALNKSRLLIRSDDRTAFGLAGVDCRWQLYFRFDQASFDWAHLLRALARHPRCLLVLRLPDQLCLALLFLRPFSLCTAAPLPPDSVRAYLFSGQLNCRRQHRLGQDYSLDLSERSLQLYRGSHRGTFVWLKDSDIADAFQLISVSVDLQRFDLPGDRRRSRSTRVRKVPLIEAELFVLQPSTGRAQAAGVGYLDVVDVNKWTEEVPQVSEDCNDQPTIDEIGEFVDPMLVTSSQMLSPEPTLQCLDQAIDVASPRFFVAVLRQLAENDSSSVKAELTERLLALLDRLLLLSMPRTLPASVLADIADALTLVNETIVSSQPLIRLELLTSLRRLGLEAGTARRLLNLSSPSAFPTSTSTVELLNAAGAWHCWILLGSIHGEGDGDGEVESDGDGESDGASDAKRFFEQQLRPLMRDFEFVITLGDDVATSTIDGMGETAATDSPIHRYLRVASLLACEEFLRNKSSYPTVSISGFCLDLSIVDGSGDVEDLGDADERASSSASEFWLSCESASLSQDFNCPRSGQTVSMSTLQSTAPGFLAQVVACRRLDNRFAVHLRVLNSRGLAVDSTLPNCFHSRSISWRISWRPGRVEAYRRVCDALRRCLAVAEDGEGDSQLKQTLNLLADPEGHQKDSPLGRYPGTGHVTQWLTQAGELAKEKISSASSFDADANEQFLDAQQRAAQTAVLSDSPAPGLTLIHGPPGTGKSSLVISIVRAASAQPSLLPILVCVDSQAALDSLTRRLRLAAPHLLLLRLAGRRRPAAADVDDLTLDAQLCRCQLEDEEFKEKSSERGVDEDRLSRRLLESADVVLSGSDALDASGLSFPLVLIDDTGNIPEYVTLCALAHCSQRLVLLGDPQYSASDSLIRRLGDSLRDAPGPRLLQLTVQHRMRRELARFPNQHFFRETMTQLSDRVAVPIAGSLAILPTVCFVNCKQLCVAVEDNHFYFKLLVRILSCLVGGQQSELAVVLMLCPKRAQMLQLRLREAQFDCVEVVTIEEFRGCEAQSIVIDAADAAVVSALPNQLAVMLTRARQRLVVIGDREVLTGGSEIWRDWLAQANEVPDSQIPLLTEGSGLCQGSTLRSSGCYGNASQRESGGLRRKFQAREQNRHSRQPGRDGGQYDGLNVSRGGGQAGGQNAPRGGRQYRGHNVPRGSGQYRGHNVPRGGGQCGGHNVPTDSGQDGGHNVPSGGGQDGGHNVPSGGGQAGGHNVPRGGGQAGGHNVPRGGGKAGGHNVPRGGGQAGGHNVPRGGGQAGGHNVPRGGGQAGGHNVPRGGGQAGGHNVPRGGGQAGGHNVPRGGGQDGGHNVPRGGGQAGGHNVPRGGGQAGGHNVPRGGGQAGGHNVPRGGGQAGGQF